MTRAVPPLSGEIGDGTVERGELRIVRLGNVDPGALVQRGDEVEEVHRIEIEFLAQLRLARQLVQIGLRRDPDEHLEDQRLGFRLGS